MEQDIFGGSKLSTSQKLNGIDGAFYCHDTPAAYGLFAKLYYFLLGNANSYTNRK